jgi:hypothetical protein
VYKVNPTDAEPWLVTVTAPDDDSGAEVPEQTITTITDRVMDGMAGWQSRPLDPGRFLAMVAN